MYNKTILVGNLTRDMELRYSQAGTAIASTAIATSRKFTSNGEKKEEVTFIDITFFGRSAEVANQYLRKGSKILVEGRIKLDQWVDQNGGKRSKHSVAVETMQMLDSKDDSAKAAQPDKYPSHAPQQQAQSYQLQQPQQHAAYQPQNMQQAQQPQQQGGQQNLPQQPPVIDVNEDEIPF